MDGKKEGRGRKERKKKEGGMEKGKEGKKRKKKQNTCRESGGNGNMGQNLACNL